jgi:hypothetical protein
VAIAVAVCALAAPGLAPARDGGAHTQISLARLETSYARGAVTSERPRCRPHRKVSLFVYDGFISDKVAITYSDSAGAWRVDQALSPGRYFAKVDAVPGCRYAVSHPVRLTG